MDSKYFVWALTQGKSSACQYYRVEVPTSQLHKLGYAEYFLDSHLVDEAVGTLARLHSDIALNYAVAGLSSLHNVKTISKMTPAMKNGREIYPPTLIYDIDDNNDFVHPFNLEAFCAMGIRGYPSAKLLEPGEGIIIHDHADRKIAGWQDGERPQGSSKVFDIARNLHEMKIRHEIIRGVHGVTVPSTTLARYMREVIGAKNVHIFPNTVVPEDYTSYPLVRKDPDTVRILWQGGHSHFVDWYPLRDALKTICQRHKNIKIVIFGEWFNWMHDVIPDEMVEHHAWVPYDAYKLKRGLLSIDINLCPLAKNVFNAGKSAIKWYEACVWDDPEATLAANVKPYSEEMVDGKTGLLYSTPDEFVEKLSTLIKDATLRKTLAANAKKWVLANRTPEKTIPDLFDFYVETRARHREALGKPVIKRPTLDEIKKVGTPLR